MLIPPIFLEFEATIQGRASDHMTLLLRKLIQLRDIIIVSPSICPVLILFFCIGTHSSSRAVSGNASQGLGWRYVPE